MSLEKIEALEGRISQIVELVRNLKEEKKRLEDEAGRMRAEIQAHKALEEEAARLRQEKDLVKDRLEKILKGIDELTGQVPGPGGLFP